MAAKKKPTRKKPAPVPPVKSVVPPGGHEPGNPAGRKTPATPLKVNQQPLFPIVGIGASAGVLAAIEAFFSAMPADTDPNMAFVLVQHLAPDHKSILVDLVKRYTRMDVQEVQDGMAVLPNCV